MIKIIEKLETTVILQVNIEAQHIAMCNSKLNVLSEIPVVFRNGSNYDYHFIIKELANAFEQKCECLEENTEKYKTFSVPIEKSYKY